MILFCSGYQNLPGLAFQYFIEKIPPGNPFYRIIESRQVLIMLFNRTQGILQELISELFHKEINQIG